MQGCPVQSACQEERFLALLICWSHIFIMKNEAPGSAAFAVFEPVEPGRAARTCAWPGCASGGEHRAPISRERIGEYHWFCLDHVRVYNASWNYYAGLSDTQMEAAIRSDLVGNRPTWPLGKGQGPDKRAFNGAGGTGFHPGHGAASQSTPFDNLNDPFGLLRGTGAYRQGAHPSPEAVLSVAERKALTILELTYPVTFEELRTQYKLLVKRHHPDTHGGAKDAEERLKRVNAAYKTLKTKLFA
jgi:hypothetical protein